MGKLKSKKKMEKHLVESTPGTRLILSHHPQETMSLEHYFYIKL
jgi:hypothetical protein